jgi:uncharacterized protein involved in response to NO
MSAPPPVLAAPHRPWFLLGVVSAVLSMTWWLLFWLGVGFAPQHVLAPAVPPGHAHGLLMSHGLFGFFIFGFLSTVFPKWQRQPALDRAAWLPGVVLGALGFALTLVGTVGGRAWLGAGVGLLALSHAAASLPLVRVFVQAGEHRALHAWVSLLGLAGGQLALLAFLVGLVQGDAVWTGRALDASVWAFLLPIYATVCHRMVPFFSRCVYPDDVMHRPTWPLFLIVGGAAGQLALTWSGAAAWAWTAHLTAALGAGYLAVVWRPWQCWRPALLGSLHLGFAWLPVSLLLFAAQSVTLASTGRLFAARAPLHALTIGMFGTLMVAMVTRVSRGHSGRSLEMSRPVQALVWLVQVVVLVRIGGELLAGGPGGLHATLAAAGLWLLVAGTWAAIHGPMYWTPRADGRPG